MRGLEPKEYLDSILDEQEQTYLSSFVENEKLYQTVRKVVLACLYHHGTLKKGIKANSLNNAAFSVVANGGRDTSNEQIGADLRALWEAVNTLEASFEDILQYKKLEPDKRSKENEAR